MIKVELINPEEVMSLYKHWGEFACQCYNTDISQAEKVGKHCMASHHYSGSRTEYFKFKISSISRACSLQLNRHSQGVVINQQSQRYCDMNNTEFVIPSTIQNNPATLEIYNNLIVHSKQAYGQIQAILSQNLNKEQSNQDARYALLESCETQGTWGFTLEALIHFMHKRLCIRSQWEIRELANLMKEEVIKILPELNTQLVPHCEYLLWCPEGNKGCGRYKSKEDFKEFVKNKKC